MYRAFFGIAVFLIHAAYCVTASETYAEPSDQEATSTLEVFFSDDLAEISSSESSVDPREITTAEEEMSVRVLAEPPANKSIRASKGTFHPNSVFSRGFTRNNGWRNDCGCGSFGSCSTKNRGDSIITFKFDVKEKGYEARFWMRHYGLKVYAGSDNARGDKLWKRFEDAPQASRVLTTEWIGNGKSTKAVKFRNGNNQTPGGRLRGTIGYELKKDGKLHSRWLIEPTMRNRGRKWQHCGNRFTITLKD